MWHFNPSQIAQIHFEISNYCNAECSECPRVKRIGEPYYSNYVDTHFLDLNIIKENFNNSISPHLLEINFCGCWGDPLTHPEIVDILKHFVKEYSDISITIHTNGSLRTPHVYEEIADVLKDSYSGVIVWGLDGLEETNHIYRKNVVWEKVQNNFRAFNKAGGKSVWQFIVFPWNYHQIKEAKNRARKENFFGFTTKISFRDEHVRDELPSEYKHKHEEHDGIFRKNDFIKDHVKKFKIPKCKLHEGFDEKTGKTIWCNSAQGHKIFVMSEGTVWPCNELGNPEGKWEELEMVTAARYNNNLHNFSLTEVMQNNYWKKLHRSHFMNQYHHQCVYTCGIIPSTNSVRGKDQNFNEKL